MHNINKKYALITLSITLLGIYQILNYNTWRRKNYQLEAKIRELSSTNPDNKQRLKIYLKGFNDNYYGPAKDKHILHSFQRQVNTYCPEHSNFVNFYDEESNQHDTFQSHIVIVDFKYAFRKSAIDKQMKKIFILYTHEPPHATLSRWKDRRGEKKKFLNVDYNYLMNYNLKSDFPFTYQIDVSFNDKSEYNDPDDFLSQNSSSNFHSSNSDRKTLISFVSNCHFADPYRLNILKILKEHLQEQMSFLGKCGSDTPLFSYKSFFKNQKDSNNIKNYKFFAAFENSRCNYYMTEKLWSQAIFKGVVPVVAGPSRHQYERFLPPDAFIHIEDYEKVDYLLKDLDKYSRNNTLYMNKFFSWKNDLQSQKILKSGYNRNYSGICPIIDRFKNGALNSSREGRIYDRIEEDLRNCEYQVLKNNNMAWIGMKFRQLFG